MNVFAIVLYYCFLCFGIYPSYVFLEKSKIKESRKILTVQQQLFRMPNAWATPLLNQCFGAILQK
jgi:hypothetical protein